MSDTEIRRLDLALARIEEALAKIEQIEKRLRRRACRREEAVGAVSLREAARLLGVSRTRTLPELVSSGKIRTVDVEGSTRVPRSEIARVAEQRRKPVINSRSSRDLMPLSHRLWTKVTKDGPTKPNMPSPCWEWTGHKDRYGYGMIEVVVDGSSRRIRRTHRLAWELEHGPIPAGLCVCHRCDNRSCCNPAHLFLGSHQENMADRDAKGRSARGTRNGAYTCPESVLHGERVGGAKLTESIVREIRSRALNGESQTSLARAYGVTQKHVSFIVRRKKWRHVA